MEEEAARVMLDMVAVFMAVRPRMPARWMAVFAYVASRPHCGMSEARAVLDLDPPELAECLKGLDEELGLITRSPGANRRERSLSLTDRGEVLARRMTAALAQRHTHTLPG